MQHLFAYGTLMCADILQAVCGESRVGLPATLHGFFRRRIRGEHYPAIYPQADDLVTGRIYQDISDAAWRKLDVFEGQIYRREALQVNLDSGQTLVAGAYVLLPTHRDLLDTGAWDFEQFLAEGKRAFLAEYAGFSQRD